MSIDVEVNMRIPGLTLKSPNEADKVINNSYVRFTKMIQVPVIPKPGDSAFPVHQRRPASSRAR